MGRYRSIAVVALVVIASLVIATLVSAHHPIVDGSAVCQPNGTWLITWTLQNSESVNGTNRYMDVDLINRSVNGFGLNTRVHPQGSAQHPTGTVTGTETLPGNTSGNITLTVRVDFQGDGPNNVTGSKTITLNGSCTNLNFRVSHIECVGDAVQIHLILNQLPAASHVSDYGSGNIVLNGNNVVVPFTGRTGNAAHYTLNLTPALDGVYTITSGSVTIQTTTGPRTESLANVPYSETITGCERENTASVTPSVDCEGWNVAIDATEGYTVTGATSGLWNGAWSVDYNITLNYTYGQPRTFNFTGTLYRPEECQQNRAEVVPNVDCEGWSLSFNATEGYTVSGATSGLWNGAWSADYSIVLTYEHGVPAEFTFSGTLYRSEECQQNNASVTPYVDCEGWVVTINATDGYSVSGATSGSWNGAWSADYFIVLTYEHGVPNSFTFSGTVYRPEECQQNRAEVVPNVDCEGWSLSFNATEGYSVSGVTSGSWGGAWSVVYNVTLTYQHGIPNEFTFSGTVYRPEECQQNSASVNPSVDCEGWSLNISATEGYTVTGATSGLWNGAWSADYSIVLTYEHGVPSEFTFSGTVYRPEECQQNSASVTPSVDCEGWNVVVNASEGATISGDTSGAWGGSNQATYNITVSWPHGLPSELNFSETLSRPDSCQQNSASVNPSVDCEGWSLTVNVSEGGEYDGQTSGTWDESGQATYSIVVVWLFGEPREVTLTGTLTRPEECNPEPGVNTASAHPEATCDGWNVVVNASEGATITGETSGTWNGGNQATYHIVVSWPSGEPMEIVLTGTIVHPESCTPPPDPFTFCFVAGSESWNVDVSTLSVYGNPMVSREDTINNVGMVIVHSLDSRVFNVGDTIPLTFADQNVFAEITYLGNMICTINTVATPEPPVADVPCPLCEQYQCEAFVSETGAEVVTYPMNVAGYFVVVARGLNFSLPNADVNGDYQIAFYITGAVRDGIMADLPADTLITEYGVPCSICILDWGVRPDGAVFYGIGLTEFDAALAIAASRGVDLSQEIMREAHSVAVQWHADQLDGPTPYGWYVP